VCEWRSKIGYRQEKNHIQPNTFGWWMKYVQQEVNGTLKSDIEKKRITYSRIHSAGGLNTFDTKVNV
jgi:hypothetical protein